MKDFSIIVAMDSQRGIGKDGVLPWHLSADLKHFKSLTTETAPGMRNAVIMGRKTWESIPERFRPLSGRLNIVLTRNVQYDFLEGVLPAISLDQALLKVSQLHDIDSVFVIGGAQVYQQAIGHSQCRQLCLTLIDKVFDCDAFFPEIPHNFHQVSASEDFSENGLIFRFSVFLK